MAEPRTGRKASGPKLTKEQKTTVIEMAMQGISAPEIARQMKVDVLRVGGTIRSAKNSGELAQDITSPLLNISGSNLNSTTCFPAGITIARKT